MGFPKWLEKPSCISCHIVMLHEMLEPGWTWLNCRSLSWTRTSFGLGSNFRGNMGGTSQQRPRGTILHSTVPGSRASGGASRRRTNAGSWRTNLCSDAGTLHGSAQLSSALRIDFWIDFCLSVGCLCCLCCLSNVFANRLNAPNCSKWESQSQNSPGDLTIAIDQTGRRNSPPSCHRNEPKASTAIENLLVKVLNKGELSITKLNYE